MVLWCLHQRDLYGAGLVAYGLDPRRLVLAATARDEDILWAIEEGLRTPSLAAVVGEVGRLPMVAGRRLQLAAERSGVTAFLLRRWRNGEAAAAERDRPSAALTRWRITALPSIDTSSRRNPLLQKGREGIGWVGRPRWRVELLRCRGGVPGLWEVEAADATGHVCVSPALADRPAAASGREARPDAAAPLRRAG